LLQRVQPEPVEYLRAVDHLNPGRLGIGRGILVQRVARVLGRQ
jgi:hypothetical protein